MKYKRKEGGIAMAVTVTIVTRDGKVYTDPTKVHIPRNKDTEAFYRMVENFVLDKDEKKDGASAS